MLIMGIDPGTAITGFGIIDNKGNNFKPIHYGCIRTSSKLALAERLQLIHKDMIDLIDEFRPEACAIEQLFFNKNIRTALAVGHARGVIMLAAANKDIPVFEYTPLQVKQSVVGYGRAQKSQVQKMVQTFLALNQIPKPDDVADALAISICHAHSYKLTRQLRAKGETR